MTILEKRTNVVVPKTKTSELGPDELGDFSLQKSFSTEKPKTKIPKRKNLKLEYV